MINIDQILHLSERFCKFAKHFNLQEFDSLPTGIKYGKLSSAQHEILSQLVLSGIGGSRNTYILNAKKALKVAKNQRGLEGNKIEFENLKKYNSTFLPKAFNRASSGYSWIEVELVRPLRDYYEITDLIGIDGNLFIELVDERFNFSSFDETISSMLDILNNKMKNLSSIAVYYGKEYYIDKISKLKDLIGNQYLNELDKLINSSGLLAGELALLSNWGKSASGHLVILDIGN